VCDLNKTHSAHRYLEPPLLIPLRSHMVALVSLHFPDVPIKLQTLQVSKNGLRGSARGQVDVLLGFSPSLPALNRLLNCRCTGPGCGYLFIASQNNLTLRSGRASLRLTMRGAVGLMVSVAVRPTCAPFE